MTARWRAGEAGPARKYYRITATGDQTLRRSAIEWNDFTCGVGAILREVTAR